LSHPLTGAWWTSRACRVGRSLRFQEAASMLWVSP
jgi:hypothetical protein